jgi:hypothetical protein
MKAPGSNEASPALLTPSSFDIYFGENISKPSSDVVVRSAYAMGSGQGSIGLDPRHKKFRHIFPKLSQLRDLLKWQVERHYAEQQMDVNCNFNQVSVKIYFNNKKTNIHTDTQFDNNHVAVESNSQVPQTPVVIATIGDNKLLTFEEFSRSVCGEKKVVHVSKGTRELKFYQKSGSIFLMDHRDEEINKNGMFWKHSSHLEDGKNGCSISILFRVSQVSAVVIPGVDNLANPVMYGAGKKEQQFNRGWRLMRNPTYRKWYEEEVRKIEAKINTMVLKYCCASIHSYITPTVKPPKIVNITMAPKNIPKQQQVLVNKY